MAKLSRYEENMRWLEEEVGKLTNRHTPEENAQWFEAEVKKLAERRNRSSNQESSIVDSSIEQLGANSANFGVPWSNFEAYATNLGVPSVNVEIASSIHPTSSIFHPPMSTNHGGQPISDSSAQSFMSSQGESLYQDSFYRNSNFGVHQHNSSNFGVPQHSNSDFSFPYSRTVLVKIHSELYPISHEVLDWFFSGIGKVESIECFDQYNPFHSRICFQDRDSAVRAFYWLHGSCIYKGCCRVELIFEAETIDRANEMDALNHQIFEDFRIDEPVRQNPDFSIVDRNSQFGDLESELETERRTTTTADKCSCSSVDLAMAGSVRLDSIDAILLKISEMQALTEKFKTDVEEFSAGVDKVQASSEKMGSVLRQSVDDPRQWREEVEEEDAKAEASIEEPNQEIEEVPRELQIQFRSSEVNSYLPNPIVVDIAWKEKDELVDASIGIRWSDFRMNSSYCLSFPSAHQVFVKMSAKDESLTDRAFEHVIGFRKISKDCSKFFVAHKVFVEKSSRDVQVLIGLAGGNVILSVGMRVIEMAKGRNVDHFVFDPGGGLGLATLDERRQISVGQVITLVELMKLVSPQITEFRAWICPCWSIIIQIGSGPILVYDPGGVLPWCLLEGLDFEHDYRPLL